MTAPFFAIYLEAEMSNTVIAGAKALHATDPRWAATLWEGLPLDIRSGYLASSRVVIEAAKEMEPCYLGDDRAPFCRLRAVK